FAVFLIWGIIELFAGNTLAYDRLFSAAIALIAFFLYKRMKLSLAALLFGLFALVLHNAYFYGNFYFGIPFDRIMHFTAGMAVAFIFYEFMSTKKINKWGLMFLVIFIAAGITSMMEILEFFGYHYLQGGEGIFFYGTGDFGEYNNVSWDLISNTSGAIFASLLLFLKKYKYKK
ncbi:DUF2238 domain-containing protein, partial [Candidatus Woesearchaeota archaeon]|nr:DUF2238 domain-containing protein [Candidatus Woesearchaeota archaeon]